MSLFQYPKTYHTRNQAPRKFKNYGTYKRYLQYDFRRVCVYCRQPDTSAPNLNFGVDHYRPKGIPRFSNLICEYNNLYYCCGQCNSRKNDYWPSDELKGLYIVNPCDFEMASHLRFDSRTGKVDHRTKHGEQTIELLQLNDDALVSYRKSALQIVALLNEKIKEIESDIVEAEKLKRKGNISQADFDDFLKESSDEINSLKDSLLKQTGDMPLSPPPQSRNGLKLVR